MHYTLNQLQIFLRIVQEKSITKAAESLHLTQPAVSNQLKNFQQQFDMPLTELIGRKVYVTGFGMEIAKSAEKILGEVATINAKTHEFRGILTGRLVISVVSTGKYIMPYFLTSFMRDNPGVELQMDVTNKASVIEDIGANSVDFSLVSIVPHFLRVEKLDLLPNKLYLVGNQSFKAGQSTYSKQIFKDLPLIYREQGSGTRQAMENFISRNKVAVVKKMELTSNEAVKQAVLAGLGFSIMPLIGIRHELRHKELQIIPVKGLPIQTTWSLIWPKGKIHSPAARAFLQYIKDEKSTIVQNHFNWYKEY